MSDMDQSDVLTPVEAETAPPAVPVVTQTPSNETAAEPVVVEEKEPLPLADAATILVTLVRDGRRAGDGDVDAAVADVEAAIAAQ